jgi:FlaA1/EpsC-like NDP-sugar epimerase
MTTYSIGEMAKKLGKTVKTLQNWDKGGKLIAYRTPTNRRYYTHQQYLDVSGKSNYKRTGEDIDAVFNKTVLITGGTGSLGNALTNRIVDVAKKVIIYSRCELKQANMRQKFADKDNIRYMIGNIRDLERLKMVLSGVDVCIHAAALKRVEVNTYSPFEAVNTNVIGSMNVIKACLHNDVSKALLISTDKSCSPSTLYGGTKFVAEQMFINGNNYSGKNSTTFTISRYGNVYASNGSVAHIFKKQAEEGLIKLTHEEMTRFFMSLDEAVDLNLFALNNAIGGEIFIPKLKGTTIKAFADAFAPGIHTKIIGLRGYEKIHEELISETEASYVVDMGEYYKVVPPGVTDKALGWDASYPDEPKMKPFRYTSDKVEQFAKEELLEFDK